MKYCQWIEKYLYRSLELLGFQEPEIFNSYGLAVLSLEDFGIDARNSPRTCCYTLLVLPVLSIFRSSYD